MGELKIEKNNRKQTKFPPMKIGEVLDAYNEKAKEKLTKRALAILVINDRDISVESKEQKIANWEAGRNACGHQYLKRLAEVLKCKVGDLI